MYQQSPAGKQRRARTAIEDQIAVAARQSAIAGMKVVRYHTHPAHADIAGQFAVGTQEPCGRTANGAGVEVRDLFARVHSGVGAPGTDDFDTFVRNTAYRALERRLDAV